MRCNNHCRTGCRISRFLPHSLPQLFTISSTQELRTIFTLCQEAKQRCSTTIARFWKITTFQRASGIYDAHSSGQPFPFRTMSRITNVVWYFRILREDDCNILQNLSKEEFREFRSLVIDMVLATDMSFHFQQLKNMKNLLSLAEPSVDKSKAVSLVLHCCDISHPAKRWDLHHR